MSSFGHDLSDDSDANEQEKNSGPQIELLSTFTPDVSFPNAQYAAFPQLSTAHAMAPATYPYPDPFYRSIFAPYDGHPYPPQPYYGPPTPMVHLQLMGIQQAGIPLPSDAVEGPVFVNAKQYNGILRRRQSRAKAESEKKAMKSSKPYVYESRHLHALKRARGCGGRFILLKKNENQEENEIASGDRSPSNINPNSDENGATSSEGKS